MQEILSHSTFKKIITDFAKSANLTVEQVEKDAIVFLKEMYTQQNPMIQTLAVRGSQYLLDKGYDTTIDVNANEIKSLAKTMRRHPVAFVMTHKTYIDMMVLGVALARHGLPIPYIFGGINMSFLGLGELGRKSGAIFIRRSFKDNPLYKLILKFYISFLIEQQSHFMWAIEGTRSRTGKILWPKMGILKYIVEAEKLTRKEVKYIPVSIVYDLIPDVKDMIVEGRGFEKSPESLMWLINYMRKMINTDLGKISIRFGDAVDKDRLADVDLPKVVEQSHQPQIPKFAFDLVHDINSITPITTGSLICAALLSTYALSKQGLEEAVHELMELIENHKSDALVERGRPFGQSIQTAINRFIKEGILKKIGETGKLRYAIVPENYMRASYYANMCVQYLYHRAFIELALMKVGASRSQNRMTIFWKEIMELRELFKFEFFYSKKALFSDIIERDLDNIDTKWADTISNPKVRATALLSGQKILLSQTVLYTYVEAYKVVAQCLLDLDSRTSLSESSLLEESLLKGEEMHWHGLIQRIGSVSKPFVMNGVRYAANREYWKPDGKVNRKEIKKWLSSLIDISERIQKLQLKITASKKSNKKVIPLSKKIIPGSKTEMITSKVIEGEDGPRIGAFFDLDRTLIKGFSAKKFFQKRLTSGKMTSKEVLAQFNGVMIYAMGNRNFAGLAAIGAKGINGLDESLFIETGEEVYYEHLAKEIYPESRALVDAHLAKGHTVAIISAATPYQVNPVARDLGIDHVMCTRMEVVEGKFTGKIVEPACWGEGKAIAARSLAQKLDLDLSKSHFYTDSAEDIQLMDIVGYPHPVNPDHELSKIAYERNWPILRFNDEKRPGISNLLRTFLAVGSLVPGAMSGVVSGAANWSVRDGVNNMMATVGDVGCTIAGIKLVVHNEHNVWDHRPAVFLFNHQSNVDLLIMAKILRKDAVGVGKKELQYTPAGPFLKAAGLIFLDRKNSAKSIEALKPAVEALKSGTSIGIAPEGTRSYDYQLSTFKKGAFHIAMQAGVPIVPVVIKNAHDVMPRGSNFIKPSVVEVVVLDPISTKRWKKETLDKNVKKVRDQFLKVLGQDTVAKKGRKKKR